MYLQLFSNIKSKKDNDIIEYILGVWRGNMEREKDLEFS